MFVVDAYLKQFPNAKSEQMLGFYLLSMYSQDQMQDMSLSEINLDVIEKYLRKFLDNLERDSSVILQNAQIKIATNGNKLFDQITLEVESYLSVIVPGIQNKGRWDEQMNRYIKDGNSYDFLSTFIRSFIFKMLVKNYDLAIPTEKAFSIFPSLLTDEAYLNLIDEYTYAEPNLPTQITGYTDYRDLVGAQSKFGIEIDSKSKSMIEKWLESKKLES